MKHPLLTLAILLFVSSFVFAGCSSSESPYDSVDRPDKTITLSVSAPANRTTKATADHSLRFIAILYKGVFNEGSTAGVSPEFVERKELLASDKTGQITFSVEEGKYSIILFADYIPSDSERDSESGLYPDKYYNTNGAEPNNIMKAGVITLKSSPEINNDNLDCFSHMLTVTKNSLKLEKAIELKRMTAKICVKSNTSLRDGNTLRDITVSSLPYYSKMSITASSMAANNVSESATGNLSSVALTPDVDGEAGEEGKLLFYYYTLANTNYQELQNLGFLRFNVNYGSGDVRKVEVGQSKIPAVRNKITNVKGSFLSPYATEKGDIVLNLTVNPDINDVHTTLEVDNL